MACHLEKVFYVVSFSVLTKLLLSHLSASFSRLISSVWKERAIIDNFLFMVFFKDVFTYIGYAINRRTPCAFHIICGNIYYTRTMNCQIRTERFYV